MSTSSHGRSGLRRPFGSINANTLSSSKISGKSREDNPNPVKKGKKKGLLSRTGLFTSILQSASKKKERAEAASGEPLALESPTKKTRVEEADTKPSVAEAVLSRSCVNALYPNEDKNIGEMFRIQSSNEIEEIVNNFWDAEMEEMLSLKIANPIMDDSRDDFEYPSESNYANESRCKYEGYCTKTAKTALTEDLDGEATGDSLFWMNRLTEHEDGFRLTFEQ
mmetsp:Transcript_935/g.1813  ORF Transcript_935/g.1813 Transcript_935/m.1813 type:complete len:223 (-) Transcript_935:208-876(-)